jgi:hypothetical protein
MSKYIYKMIVATLALGSQPKQGVARLRAKRKTRESHHMLPGVPKNVKEWTFTLPSETPMLGVGVSNELPNIQSKIAGVKTHCLEEFSISLKKYWSVNVWDKLTIWLSITKSQESTQFPCV